MAAEEQRAKRQTNDVGPTGAQVAENLRSFRTERGLSTIRLSQLLGEIGRPIQATGITKIEKKERKVDVDDLVALALVLNVSPLALLLPSVDGDEMVPLAPTVELPAWLVWEWAEGASPAIDVLVDDGDDSLVRETHAYESLSLPPQRLNERKHPASRAAFMLRKQVRQLVPGLRRDTPSASAYRLAEAQRWHQRLTDELDQIKDDLGKE
ncbi:helix-turn-helix transcriptional regulator [Streptosporangium sp. NPDC002524]|uniref:helix-turn-helix domain-containing protein n=1 Tax=Streptosporangium sp. NPDC002524 TaxID=3154537 RepID=UPI003331FFAB